MTSVCGGCNKNDVSERALETLGSYLKSFFWFSADFIMHVYGGQGVLLAENYKEAECLVYTINLRSFQKGFTENLDALVPRHTALPVSPSTTSAAEYVVDPTGVSTHHTFIPAKARPWKTVPVTWENMESLDPLL